MSLYQQLTQAAEQARGTATRAADSEQAWAGRFAEQFAAYINAPQEAVHFPSAREGRVMLHVGYPELRQSDGWHAFDLEIATDVQQRHRFVLPILFQPIGADPETPELHRVKLGTAGRVFEVPTEKEDLFDHLFATMLADLQTPAGQNLARQGGIRRLG
jgi:hypothetical protein